MKLGQKTGSINILFVTSADAGSEPMIRRFPIHRMNLKTVFFQMTHKLLGYPKERKLFLLFYTFHLCYSFSRRCEQTFFYLRIFLITHVCLCVCVWKRERGSKCVRINLVFKISVFSAKEEVYFFRRFQKVFNAKPTSWSSHTPPTGSPTHAPEPSACSLPT